MEPPRRSPVQRDVLRWIALGGLLLQVGCQARAGLAPPPSPVSPPPLAPAPAKPDTTPTPTTRTAASDLRRVESVEAPQNADADAGEEITPDTPPHRAERHGATIEVDRPSTPRAAHDDGFMYRAEPLPEWWGCGDFGQVGLRPTSFASLTAERDVMDAEVHRESRDLRDLRGCLREWDAKIRAVREAKRVDRARLAELRSFRQRTVDAIARAKERRASYRARRDELQAELDRRRQLIESGICPSEPCPPGTRLADPSARPVRE